MENTDNLNNQEKTPKMVNCEARNRAARECHERNKDNEEY